MRILPYDRAAAVRYARKWALSRSPVYYDFEHIGGDCTNFCSQCIFAGAPVMNYAPTFGWYYISLDDRAPAWTGVEYLYSFLVGNRASGPFGREVGVQDVQAGDVVQLGKANGDYYHTPVITKVQPHIMVCAHTRDRKDVPLSSYLYDRARFIHIEGYRR